MKFIIVLAVSLVSHVCLAETAIERTELYFDDLKARQYKAAASHFDPEQLKEFRVMMEFYKEIPEEPQREFIKAFFGEHQSTESVQALSDTEFFAGMFIFIMQRAEATGGLNFDGLEILGTVAEGEDKAHLVTRNRISMGEVEIEAMEVVSLKKYGNNWKVMMSGRIKGLPAQLKSAFTQN